MKISRYGCCGIIEWNQSDTHMPRTLPYLWCALVRRLTAVLACQYSRSIVAHLAHSRHRKCFRRQFWALRFWIQFCTGREAEQFFHYRGHIANAAFVAAYLYIKQTLGSPGPSGIIPICTRRRTFVFVEYELLSLANVSQRDYRMGKHGRAPFCSVYTFPCINC